MAAYYAGIDLGASHVRAVVGEQREIEGTIENGTGQITDEKRVRETPEEDEKAVREAVVETLHRACDDAGVAPGRLAAVGVGSIGPLDLEDGAVVNPAGLAVDGRIRLTEPILEVAETEQVYLHNDADAGVVGERLHSTFNPDDMVYLTISSGIGAGVAVDGNVLSGWDGNAGEVGHMVVDSKRRMSCGCSCAMDGHWEAYCSGEKIPEFAERLHQDEDVWSVQPPLGRGRPGMPTALPLGDPDFSAEDVFELAGNDQFADHVIDQVAHWNTMGVANVVHAYAPIVVRVGGAVALNNEKHVLDPVRDRLDDVILVNPPDVELTSFGEDVVLFGALASAATSGTGERSRIRS